MESKTLTLTFRRESLERIRIYTCIYYSAELGMNKTLLAYLLIVGISGTAGAGTGIILKRTIGPVDEKYPPGFSPEEYRDEKLADNLAAYKSSHSISGFTDAELVNIGLELYKEHDNSYWVGSGNADAGVTVQSVRNGEIKRTIDGVTTYFEEQISNGMVGVAKRSTQLVPGDEVKLYSGSPNNAEVASYASDPSIFNKEGYKGYLGKTPDEMFIYVISNKTTKSSSRKNENGDIVINLELDTTISTFYYKTQMKSISELDNLPQFSKVNHTYTFANDMTLKRLDVDEVYKAAKFGMAPETRNTLTYHYYADGIRDIPDLNTPFDYKVEE